LEEIERKLEIFSRKGLRTLCMAERIISEEEWLDIERQIDESNDAPDPGKALSDLAERVENNMTLIGCSAVEDRL
jgi:magnesium-transporting ATPase (P-type)